MKKLTTLFAMMSLASISCWAADATAGKAVYDTKCKTCHAADGKGNPGMAKVLKVEMKPLSATALSDAEIKKAITDGSGKMKPVSGVAGADLDNVVAYVRTLK
jgi:mono/diheme cytochrome c family protein